MLKTIFVINIVLIIGYSLLPFEIMFIDPGQNIIYKIFLALLFYSPFILSCFIVKKKLFKILLILLSSLLGIFVYLIIGMALDDYLQLSQNKNLGSKKIIKEARFQNNYYRLYHYETSISGSGEYLSKETEIGYGLKISKIVFPNRDNEYQSSFKSFPIKTFEIQNGKIKIVFNMVDEKNENVYTLVEIE